MYVCTYVHIDLRGTFHITESLTYIHTYVQMRLKVNERKKKKKKEACLTKAMCVIVIRIVQCALNTFLNPPDCCKSSLSLLV